MLLPSCNSLLLLLISNIDRYKRFITSTDCRHRREFVLHTSWLLQCKVRVRVSFGRLYHTPSKEISAKRHGKSKDLSIGKFIRSLYNLFSPVRSRYNLTKKLQHGFEVTCISRSGNHIAHCYVLPRWQACCYSENRHGLNIIRVNLFSYLFFSQECGSLLPIRIFSDSVSVFDALTSPFRLKCRSNIKA